MTWLDDIDLSVPAEDLDRRRGARHQPLHRSRRSRFPAGIRAIDWVGRAAWVTLALSVAVFLLRGVDRVRRPVVVPNGNGVPSSRVPGFDEVAFQLFPPGATTHAPDRKRCALLASTTPQRDKGLMFRRDLAGYDGVIFRWTAPSTAQFWMKDTLLPLSIAWFDEGGRFVSATDMAPCPTSDNCPRYGATAPYTVAIEVKQGGLTGLGVGPNSTIVIGGACT